jgi:hypothetical protein
MVSKLRLLPPSSPSGVTHRFETIARLRARVLRRACFKSQMACADFYKIGLASVCRYERGSVKIPGWYLVALEERARELGVALATKAAA